MKKEVRINKALNLTLAFFTGVSITAVSLFVLFDNKIQPVVENVKQNNILIQEAYAPEPKYTVITGEKFLDSIQNDYKNSYPIVTSQGSFTGITILNGVEGGEMIGTVTVDRRHKRGACSTLDITLEGIFTEEVGVELREIFIKDSDYYLDPEKNYQVIDICDGPSVIGKYLQMVDEE